MGFGEIIARLRMGILISDPAVKVVREGAKSSMALPMMDRHGHNFLDDCFPGNHPL